MTTAETSVSVDIQLGDEPVRACGSALAHGRVYWLSLGFVAALHVRTPEQVCRLRSALDELAALMEQEAASVS